jgi:ACS family hexuronate transporter-like MFS transporter
MKRECKCGGGESPTQVGGSVESGRTHYRWVVCALMFFATTINYVDRQVFGILGPRLTEEFHWTESHFSFIVSVFTLAYAIGYAAAGRMMDRIGERKGFIVAVAVWSLAAMAHGLVSPLVYSGLPWLKVVFAGTLLGGLTPAILSVAGFSAARFALGLAEGGNFPGAIKVVGQWHPKSERALSTGIFNGGTNVGVIIAAYAVPFVVVEMQWGWAVAFYLTGALGFVWLAFWLAMYDVPERHPRVSPAELAHIRSDPPDPPAHISWLSLLRHRQTWAYASAMFLVSPVWWFYLYWMPKFLKNNHGIDLAQVFWPLLVVYLMADVGSVAGGGLSSWLIRRGTSINFARKTAFLACALCVVPVIFVARVTNMWAAVLLVGVAAASHAGFSANLYTIVSDTVPRKAISSVVGIGGTAACVGMLVLSTLIGYVLDWTEFAYGEKDYLIPFVIAGSAYLVATAVIHLLLPRLEPMTFEAVGGDASGTSTDKEIKA